VQKQHDEAEAKGYRGSRPEGAIPNKEYTLQSGPTSPTPLEEHIAFNEQRTPGDEGVARRGGEVDARQELHGHRGRGRHRRQRPEQRGRRRRVQRHRHLGDVHAGRDDHRAATNNRTFNLVNKGQAGAGTTSSRR
jgi:hypothetical protein